MDEITDELRAEVAAERQAQGLPPTVEDPAALRFAATVLRRHDERQAREVS